MSENVPSWPDTVSQAVVGSVPVLGGFLQPFMARANAADRQRNTELDERINAALNNETLEELKHDPRIDSFVMRSLERAHRVAWRQQREVLADVVVAVIREQNEGRPTAIDEGELLVAALMDMTPMLVAGLTASMAEHHRRTECIESRAAAREAGHEDPPAFEPGEPLPPLVAARLIALGLLELGPTSYGRTPFIPSRAASAMLDLLSPLSDPPVYD